VPCPARGRKQRHPGIRISADAVGFEFATGARQNYYRKPVAIGGVVLPWELPRSEAI
jgi:hypothetical protein